MTCEIQREEIQSVLLRSVGDSQVDCCIDIFQPEPGTRSTGQGLALSHRAQGGVSGCAGASGTLARGSPRGRGRGEDIKKKAQPSGCARGRPSPPRHRSPGTGGGRPAGPWGAGLPRGLLFLAVLKYLVKMVYRTLGNPPSTFISRKDTLTWNIWLPALSLCCQHWLTRDANRRACDPRVQSDSVPRLRPSPATRGSALPRQRALLSRADWAQRGSQVAGTACASRGAGLAYLPIPRMFSWG